MLAEPAVVGRDQARLKGLLLLLTLGASLSVGWAADWPQWRDADRDGCSRETGLMQTWPAEGPPLVWEATGLGGGHSSVVLQGDKIFTTGETKEDSFAIALKRSTGAKLWSTKIGKAGAPGWGGYSGPRSSPATDGALVFVVGQWGEFVCLDAATGREKWRKHMEKDFGAPRPEWGYAESPLLDGAQVVVTPGGPKGAIVALAKTSGRILWQTKDFTDAAEYASLIIAEIGGVRQYIQLTQQSVVGVAAADGRLLWRAPRKGSTAVVATPVYHDGLIYVTSSYGTGCNLFKVTAADGKFRAEQVYANKTMLNHHGGVIRIGEHIYGHSEGKGWICQDLRTGEERWRERTKLGQGSLVYADGAFYLRAEDDGTVALVKSSPEGYQEHGRLTQPRRSDQKAWAHPVIADGKLYLRDQDRLFCYDVRAR